MLEDMRCPTKEGDVVESLFEGSPLPYQDAIDHYRAVVCTLNRNCSRKHGESIESRTEGSLREDRTQKERRVLCCLRCTQLLRSAVTTKTGVIGSGSRSSSRFYRMRPMTASDVARWSGYDGLVHLRVRKIGMAQLPETNCLTWVLLLPSLQSATEVQASSI